MRVWRYALVIFLLFGLLSGCVTRTEQRPYRPYAAPKQESLSQEVRRVFGWESKPVSRTRQEPFYKRFAQRVTQTVGGLFGKEAPARTPKEKLQRQIQQEQAEAIRKLREQTSQE